jgi:uncharacterized protein YPO0396
MSNPLFDSLQTDHEAGFRLKYAEFFNWGTFNNVLNGEIIAPPYRITPQSQTVALQGKKGSGKSTFVDGLITLLVQPQRSKNLYNQASGTSEENKKSKGRSEQSYFWGNYGETSEEEDSIQLKNLALRSPKDNHHTVLIACFTNGQQHFSLVQIWFWKNDAIKKTFIVAPKALSVEEHFSNLGFETDIKARKQFESLATGTNVFFTDDFKSYQRCFREHFGIKTDEALRLFHKIVGSKELGNVDKVVKEFILQDATEDIENRVSDMYRSNETLINIKKMIDDDERQLELLEPIIDLGKDYETLNEEIVRLQNLIQQLPNYMTLKRLELLNEEIKNNNRELQELEMSLSSITESLEILRKEEVTVRIAMNDFDVQKLIDEKEIQKKSIDAIIKPKQEKAKTYNELSKQLQYTHKADNEKIFKAIQKQAEKEKEELEKNIALGDAVLIDTRVKFATITEKYKNKNQELIDLKKRPSNIHNDNQVVRDKIIKELGIKETDLPFVGELMQVKSEHKHWQDAIEKLFRSFALNILVPEKYEKKVNRFINLNRMKQLVTYEAIPNSSIQSFLNSSEGGVIDKIEFKEGEPFRSYLRKRLVNDFDYECFEEDDDYFRKCDKGLTIKGLQNNRGRYRKDDREGLRYVLGWDTFANIELVSNELRLLLSQKQTLEIGVENQGKELKKQKDKLELLGKFLAIEFFSDIDSQKEETSLAKLGSEIEKLRNAPKNKQFEILKSQLKGITDSITSSQTELITKSTDRTNQFSWNNTCQKELEKTLMLIGNISIQEVDIFRDDFEKYFRSNPLNIKRLEIQEMEAKNKYISDLQIKVGNKNVQKVNIESCMKDYLGEFQSSTLISKVESLYDFEKRYQDIAREELKEHQDKFEFHLKEDFTNSFINFKTYLEETQLNQIHRDVKNINKMLENIPFESNFYIQLNKVDTKDTDILAFKKRLREVLEGGIGMALEQQQKEATFKRIQSLIDDFKQNPKAQKRLIDVRNWVAVNVKKYRMDTKEDTGHAYQDSSARSGGQQTELTYTILAAAIAQRFGLNSNENDSISKSFRFVILDEAFSKLDSNTPQKVMEMFKRLRLQLMVVIPDREKLNLIPNYLGWIHFVSNSEEGNKSEIMNLNIDYNPQKLVELGI